MKPVKKGNSPHKYKEYGDAKPDLIDRLGSHCSYCEAHARAQDLHVEHIYPKDPHPSRRLKWNNFLVACNSCNSFKNDHQGNRRQRELLKRYLWPHLDNTFNAFCYFPDGRLIECPTLPPAIRKLAAATREMVGLLKSPAVAADYEALGIAYDGITLREQAWSQALGFRKLYLAVPSPDKAVWIGSTAAKMGYFSIWMHVFRKRPEVRRELIRAFKADSACFDPNTKPLKKGRT